MQMHMVVRVHMIQLEARFSKRFELRPYFSLELFPDSRIKEKFKTCLRKPGRKGAIRVHKIRDLPLRQNTIAFHQRQMEANLERRALPGALDGVRGEGGSHHQACGRKDSLLVCLRNGLIDRQRQAEIISGDYDSFQWVLCDADPAER